eukprot:SAG22_NODE_162_length_16848_cov_16.978267_12_plen_165_part_00
MCYAFVSQVELRLSRIFLVGQFPMCFVWCPKVAGGSTIMVQEPSMQQCHTSHTTLYVPRAAPPMSRLAQTALYYSQRALWLATAVHNCTPLGGAHHTKARGQPEDDEQDDLLRDTKRPARTLEIVEYEEDHAKRKYREARRSGPGSQRERAELKARWNALRAHP